MRKNYFYLGLALAGMAMAPVNVSAHGINAVESTETDMLWAIQAQTPVLYRYSEQDMKLASAVFNLMADVANIIDKQINEDLAQSKEPDFLVRMTLAGSTDLLGKITDPYLIELTLDKMKEAFVGNGRFTEEQFNAMIEGKTFNSLYDVYALFTGGRQIPVMGYILTSLANSFDNPDLLDEVRAKILDNLNRQFGDVFRVGRYCTEFYSSLTPEEKEQFKTDLQDELNAKAGKRAEFRRKMDEFLERIPGKNYYEVQEIGKEIFGTNFSDAQGMIEKLVDRYLFIGKDDLSARMKEGLLKKAAPGVYFAIKVLHEDREAAKQGNFSELLKKFNEFNAQMSETAKENIEALRNLQTKYKDRPVSDAIDSICEELPFMRANTRREITHLTKQKDAFLELFNEFVVRTFQMGEKEDPEWFEQNKDRRELMKMVSESMDSTANEMIRNFAARLVHVRREGKTFATQLKAMRICVQGFEVKDEEKVNEVFKTLFPSFNYSSEELQKIIAQDMAQSLAKMYEKHAAVLEQIKEKDPVFYDMLVQFGFGKMDASSSSHFHIAFLEAFAQAMTTAVSYRESAARFIVREYVMAQKEPSLGEFVTALKAQDSEFMERVDSFGTNLSKRFVKGISLVDEIDEAVQRRILGLFNITPSGMSSINASSNASGRTYNLRGIAVAEGTKGVVISDGRTRLVK